ncbi:RICIN domain-containing protein [Streptomyces sp. NPDC017991]|uniref:RICIN domain-containing protein n=1 Tax=Streptomyces sp. NPDC017991 TaxID=3365026 RepID=UPI0037AD02FD
MVAVSLGLLATVLSAPTAQSVTDQPSLLAPNTEIKTLSGRCVQGSKAASVGLIQETCNNPSVQRFDLRPVADDKWEIRTSGLCVGVRGVSTADRAVVQTYPCDGGQAQRFGLLPMGGPFYMIRTFAGKCVEVDGLDTNRAPLLQQPCADKGSQKFFIDPPSY